VGAFAALRLQRDRHVADIAAALVAVTKSIVGERLEISLTPNPEMRRIFKIP
jgi:hypothetical protein